MAMGLGFLGRGKVRPILHVAAVHLMGATLGGAALGGLLGWFGSVLSLPAWRPEIVGAAAIFAIWQGLRWPREGLGLHRQVPRGWGRTMAPLPRFFLWGILLGCGVASVIPYSAFVVLLATQLTSGIVLGCVAGALFGLAREGMALLLLLQRQNREHPVRLVALLPALDSLAQRLNLVWLFGGTLLLIVTGWP